jgi:16S rRNA (cytosine967-C5)-methyltransferase
VSIARDHALAELDSRRLPGWLSQVLRSRNIAEPEGRDRALSNQITIGVVKNLLHLQWLIEHFSERSRKTIDPLVQKILAIGMYQLRFLDRIPPSAAVHEAVEQAKRFGQKRAAGFVNAVLRKATREELPTRPDRLREPSEYARLVLSHPPELFGHLEKLFGPEQALLICEHNNREPPIIVRLISGEFRGEGVQIRPHERPGMFVVEGASPTHLAGWSKDGIAQVQDPTAAGVVAQLEITAGELVLDRCCGRGTKTMQMREAAGDSGSVIAIDPSEERCSILQRVAVDRGITNIKVHRAGSVPRNAMFPKILIDAPCSNSGVLARRPEAGYAQDDKALKSLARLQDTILDDTAAALLAGGRMVYSTCSIWPAENSDRVQAFLSRHRDYRMLREKLTLPSTESEPTRYHDGGYFAVLQRS